MTQSHGISPQTLPAAERPAVWVTLAHLLEYPGPDFAARLTAASLAVPQAGEAVAMAWERFHTAMKRLSPDEREELYTSTFDLRPACVPYVSIHLFGEENFQRGQFMAALLGRYRQAGFDAGGELPDHVAALLRFAAQVEPEEQRELARYCLLGPVRRMAESLAEEHPYRALLEAVEAAVQSAHPDVEAAPCPLSSATAQGRGGCSCTADFLRGANRPGCRPEEEEDV